MTHDFIYHNEETKVTFMCDMYYAPEELGSVDAYGLKNEPDYPAECYIEKIYFVLDHHNRNIEALISDEVKEDIIKQFLEEFEYEEI